jgi:hypothetical protein
MFAGETTATDANAEQAYQFKARPVNKKVMESAGDLGVPRVVKKAPTVQREFNLSATRPTSARGKLDVGDELKTPLFSSFAKAVEPPKASPRATVSKAAAAALVKPKDFAPTKPVGFSFSSSSRQTSARLWTCPMSSRALCSRPSGRRPPRRGKCRNRRRRR